MTHRHRAAAAGIALAFVGLHAPFLAPTLEDLDSFNFALGLLDFDVADHRPHPPGYPVFMLAAKATYQLGFSEAHTLSLLSVAAGTLSLWAITALFRTLDPDRSAWRALAAAVVAVTSPLVWVTSVRPLSDSVGLLWAVACQAALFASRTPRGVAFGALLAGVGAGVRSQVIPLTVPVLILVAARLRQAPRWKAVVAAATGFGAGVLVWGVPLMALSGGPAAYWFALSGQSTEDLSGVQMLWTTPTVRQLANELYFGLVAPWHETALGIGVLALAGIGGIRLMRDSRHTPMALAVAYGPYLGFTILFQEAVTTRYAMPLVVPVAYLAIEGLHAFRRAPLALAAGLAVVNVAVAQPALIGYGGQDAPALRLFRDMQIRAASTGASEPPVLAMHRRAQLDLRRPRQWVGGDVAALAQLTSPPKHEWLEVVEYWNRGGRAPVWFVADPLRSDLALIARSPHVTGYRWPFQWFPLWGGVRPNEMDWHVLEPPQWYLGEGWALTPETAGVAVEDGMAAKGPLRGWIRRETVDVNLVVGGRNFGGQPVTLGLDIDGRQVSTVTVDPGFFLAVVTIAADAVAGPGDYAALTIRRPDGGIAIEQFDAQPAGRPVFGFGAGWHEQEYNPSTGLLWRWTSDRAELRVRGAGQALRLTLAGETDPSTPDPRVTVRVGGRQIADERAGPRFAFEWDIEGDLVAAEDSIIIVETDGTHVPAEISWRSPDRRRLGLKVFECRIGAAS